MVFASVIVGLWRWNCSDRVDVCERGVFLRWVCFIFDQDIFLTTTFFYANGHFVMFYRCILGDNITALLTIKHRVAYKSELQHCIHVCTSSFFACLLLYASAVCIAHRNALHTSTDPYCILFLPVLIAVPRSEEHTSELQSR